MWGWPVAEALLENVAVALISFHLYFKTKQPQSLWRGLGPGLQHLLLPSGKANPGGEPTMCSLSGKMKNPFSASPNPRFGFPETSQRSAAAILSPQWQQRCYVSREGSTLREEVCQGTMAVQRREVFHLVSVKSAPRRTRLILSSHALRSTSHPPSQQLCDFSDHKESRFGLPTKKCLVCTS